MLVWWRRSAGRWAHVFGSWKYHVQKAGTFDLRLGSSLGWSTCTRCGRRWGSGRPSRKLAWCRRVLFMHWFKTFSKIKYSKKHVLSRSETRFMIIFSESLASLCCMGTTLLYDGVRLTILIESWSSVEVGEIHLHINWCLSRCACVALWSCGARGSRTWVCFLRIFTAWKNRDRHFSRVLVLEHFLSFFLSWIANTQLNHWTKRVVSTRLITWHPRNCPGPWRHADTFVCFFVCN